MSVRDVSQSLQQAIEARFADEIWVRGAISGITRSASGHVYFDLIDPADVGTRPEAVLPVTLFLQAKQRVNRILRRTNAMRMDDGVEIRIRGRLTYYGGQGRVQLVMSLIDPAFTLGQLALSRARLIAELTAEGLIDANRLLPRPVLPLRVTLITSVSSAAEADFVTEIGLSGYPFELTVIDARVQGIDAVPTLVEALSIAAANDPNDSDPDIIAPDIIAIVRGGGARTDLAAFDHADVARAIARCPIPVFVGIGHETDESVADRVAHHATKTPTACAGAIVALVRDFMTRLDHVEGRLARVAGHALDRHGARLDAATTRIGMLAGSAVERRQAQLDTLQTRTFAAVDRGLERHHATLERCTLRIEALDPARLLARGWSITRRRDGVLISSVAAAPPGTGLLITVADGTITGTVGQEDGRD